MSLDGIFDAKLRAEVEAAGPVRFRARPRSARLTYSWDFGDGDRISGRGAIPSPGLNGGRTTGTFARPVHTYESGGRYQVCVTLEGRCGSYTVCELVTVGDVPCGGESCEDN